MVTATDTAIEVRKYTFTVDEFLKMGEAGIFTAEDRVELIDGEVRKMAAIGPLHVTIVNRLMATLIKLLESSAVLQVQNPVQLDSYNQPQPDLSIIRARGDYYRTALPTSGDTLLAIEVADSSLAYDVREKAPRYAKSMIPEVWVVDLQADVVRVFTQPGPDGYATERVMARGETIASAGVEGLRVEVDEILG